ncbi:prepilin-type N-terminal cleavage/methylation domain-containing protein [Planctomycetota bacterium]
MKRGTYYKQCGFSFAEVMLATVILGIIAVSLLVPFTSGAAIQAEGRHRTLGTNLASDIIEDIVNTPFDQIVGAYNFTENQGHVTDAGGTVFTDPIYGPYSRVVQCQYVYMPQEQGLVAEKYILATVTVSYAGNEVATIYRLISDG